MEIKEMTDKLSNSFGGYGIYILLGAVALVFISNLGKNENEGEQMVAPTGYTAYPDAVTNANVIMSEVNNHTTNEIKNLGDTLQDNINNTTESVMEKVDTSTETLTDKIDTNATQIMKQRSDTQNTLIDSIAKNQSSFNHINNTMNQIKGTTTSTATKVNTIKKDVKTVKKDVKKVKKNIGKSKGKGKGKKGKAKAKINSFVGGYITPKKSKKGVRK